ncbi:MAG: MarC family protein [Planctomycetes bacterium]|nr:MarC family protein [Planctomycetota bacterium]
MSYFFEIYIRFFFLLTPFFVLSVFMGLTSSWSAIQRRRLALKVSLWVMLVCLVLFFFGNALFSVLGITLDAFRVGAGGLLFISAVRMVQGIGDEPRPDASDDGIAVVPLAIPVTVGPGTTGALLVMGAEHHRFPDTILGCCALIAAIATVGAILVSSSALERVLGAIGVRIISKLSALFLAALASQLILEGVRNVLFPQASHDHPTWSQRSGPAEAAPTVAGLLLRAETCRALSDRQLAEGIETCHTCAQCGG